MWLPKDERRLLSYYYRRINKVGTAQNLEISESIKALREKRNETPKSTRENIFENYNTLENTNNRLSQRGLIIWKNLNQNNIKAAHRYDHSNSQELYENTKVNLSITLTIGGYDLGRKYSSWWTRSGLWFAEYKDHWFWLILSFLGGIVGALLVNWLSSLFTKSSGC